MKDEEGLRPGGKGVNGQQEPHEEIEVDPKEAPGRDQCDVRGLTEEAALESGAERLIENPKIESVGSKRVETHHGNERQHDRVCAHGREEKPNVPVDLETLPYT